MHSYITVIYQQHYKNKQFFFFFCHSTKTISSIRGKTKLDRLKPTLPKQCREGVNQEYSSLDEFAETKKAYR